MAQVPSILDLNYSSQKKGVNAPSPQVLDARYVPRLFRRHLLLIDVLVN
jgi:hypothetical protein